MDLQDKLKKLDELRTRLHIARLFGPDEEQQKLIDKMCELSDHRCDVCRGCRDWKKGGSRLPQWWQTK